MRLLPCDYRGGRFLLRVPLPTGRVARMLVDTGGGFSISPAAAEGLPTVATGLDEYPQGVVLTIDPPVIDGRGHALLLSSVTDADGILPAQWFADRVWTFDHPAGELWLHGPDDSPQPADHAISLGFPYAGADRIGPFPRITVIIDDAPVELLLDTGATAVLTTAGAEALGTPTTRASSFITESMIDRWRQRHPDWPVVDHPTELAAKMIMVASVIIGDTDLGPVWFESRPDANFHRGMSQWMDRQIDGALGNNAFTGRRVTLDYPAALMSVSAPEPEPGPALLSPNLSAGGDAVAQ